MRSARFLAASPALAAAAAEGTAPAPLATPVAAVAAAPPDRGSEAAI